jgi:hypothetical protein
MSGDNMNYELGKRVSQSATSSMIVDCPHDGDDDYTVSGGWGKSADFTPSKVLSGLLITGGSGDIHIILEGGGSMILPFIVLTNDSREVFIGYRISKIVDATTTFTGKIFPII